GGGELGVLVEPGLVLAPVVGAAPVFGQLPQVPDRHPAAPAEHWELVGPAGPGEAVVQVVQVGLGDVDAEGSDLGGGHAASSTAEQIVLFQSIRTESFVPQIEDLGTGCRPVPGPGGGGRRRPRVRGGRGRRRRGGVRGRGGRRGGRRLRGGRGRGG